MNLLLDTHALLWWLAGYDMEEDVIDLLVDPDTVAVVSAASVWEAAIKAALGKLSIGVDLAEEIRSDGMLPLDVTFEHAQVAGRFPAHHRDPFDRMLVAQAQVEGLSVVTRDPAFAAYDIDIVAC